MKEVKDLNSVEYAIYYWNRVVATLICAGFIYLNWQIGVVAVVSGYIVYKVLWFSRKGIYQTGLSRFYLLGIIFYLSFVLSIFVTLDYNNYSFMKPRMEVSQIDSYLTYVVYNLPRLFHWQFIIFGFAVGIVMYVVNIELTRKNIVDRDLMSIQVDRKELYNLNLNIHTIFLVLLCIGLFFVSWLDLVIVLLIESSMFYLSRTKRIIILSSMLALLLIISLSLKETLYLPNTLYKYMLVNGFIAFTKLQLYGAGVLFFATASYWLMPYILIKLIFELCYSKKTLNKFHEQNANRYAMVKYKKGDFELGTNLEDGSIVNLTDAEMNQHMAIIGTTGAGKTVAILNMALRAAKVSYPLIFLDGKGQLDLVERLAKIALDYDRVFRVFTLRPEAIDDKYQKYVASYNPFAAGTFTEWKNRILSLFAEVKGKGQQHFALQEEDLINSVAQLLFKMGKTIDLEFLYQMLSNVDLLVEFAEKNGEDKLAYKLENMDKSLVKDVAIMLGLFVESSYGKLFQTESGTNIISLRSAIENNEMILFLLDSSAYKSDTEKMAKLIINDINSSFAELTKSKTSYCIFDEFASYASSNLSDTIVKANKNSIVTARENSIVNKL